MVSVTGSPEWTPKPLNSSAPPKVRCRADSFCINRLQTPKTQISLNQKQTGAEGAPVGVPRPCEGPSAVLAQEGRDLDVLLVGQSATLRIEIASRALGCRGSPGIPGRSGLNRIARSGVV